MEISAILILILKTILEYLFKILDENVINI